MNFFEGFQGVGCDHSSRSVYVYNGKNLCLRGGDDEQSFPTCILMLSPMEGNPKSYDKYTEHGSKNRSVGLSQLHLQNILNGHLKFLKLGEKVCLNPSFKQEQSSINM